MSPTPQTTPEKFILVFSLLGICAYLALRYGLNIPDATYTVTLNASLASAVANVYQGQLSFPVSLVQMPLYLVLALGGIPLVYQIIKKFLLGDFGADLLAGISIVTAVLLDENLAGSLVILMLSSDAVILRTFTSALVPSSSNELCSLVIRRLP